MKVVKFDRFNMDHMVMAATMLYDRGMNPSLIDDLPTHGLLAIQDGYPVYMGFIRCMEGPYAMIDSFISNSAFESEVRNRAFGIILKKLLAWAKTEGLVRVIAVTKEPSIVGRAEAYGMLPLNEFTLQSCTLK